MPSATMHGSGGKSTPRQAAVAAGLVYVTDAEPGITRRRAGRGFCYFRPGGRRITAEREKARLKALAVPPAWEDVWICMRADGHLQATGRDARGRKQYRYHPDWRRVRDTVRFNRLLDFGRALPTLRATVDRDLRRTPCSYRNVAATLVRLLETGLIRVGNEEYRRRNATYGLTTLRQKHVDVDGSRIHFEFTAKGGQRRAVSLRDPRAARIIRSLHELPGQELFQYLDENGQRCSIGSSDINEYLKHVTGEDFTAKDFRTWAATVMAACALAERAEVDSEREAQRNVVAAIKEVAAQLGNTPAVCRASYVHPGVIDAYLDGDLAELAAGTPRLPAGVELGGLDEDEQFAWLLLLQRHEASPSG